MSEVIKESGKVTIICPVYNEEKYIEKFLKSILNQDYPGDLIEILIIDGCSTDNTEKIVEEYSKSYKNIKLLINNYKTVPFALNLGIKKASGEYIIRMDAHAEYPSNYVSKLIYYLNKLNADNVGGLTYTLPANNSLIAISIAEATSSLFGIGNSYFRLKNIKEIKKVDTVPFGCFKKDIFKRIGLFDTDLTRNQDDEFNARIIKRGGSIYLIPEIRINYYARSNLIKLFKMFYQYGLFKPLVNKKIGKITTIRQLFPFVFVTYVLFLTISTFIYYKFVFLLPMLIYLILNLFFSVKIAIRKNILLVIFLPITFLVIHISYGIGYLIGILTFLVFKRKNLKIEINR